LAACPPTNDILIFISVFLLFQMLGCYCATIVQRWAWLIQENSKDIAYYSTMLMSSEALQAVNTIKL
jgi:hypothetical protein